MKVFITGGSGYIGRATIRALVRRGIAVTALARGESAARTVSALGAEPVTGELTDAGALRAAASRADGVIHLGFSYSADAGGIDAAAARALQDGVGSGPYIHTSGVWVYGDTEGSPTRIPG
ncbi:MULTISPECIES: NAD-dependent epimerase/dehydratase family protein [unclassified Streptomyces]|uniref:NAD-dependent epimerase/dehydratase family protein n=1 Tax=unclassified Streptomyces TaxID=2593676 RepID=UPI0032D58063